MLEKQLTKGRVNISTRRTIDPDFGLRINGNKVLFMKDKDRTVDLSTVISDSTCG